VECEVEERGRGTGSLLSNLAVLGELIYDWEPLELKPRNNIFNNKKVVPLLFFNLEFFVF
jgi:hypothetical protein